MRGLFARIFLSVWIAMTAVTAAFVIIEGTADEPIHVHRRENLFDHAIRQEAAAVMAHVRRGEEPLERLRRFQDRTDVTLFFFLEDRIVSTRPPSNAARQLAEHVRRGGNRDREKDSARLVGFEVPEGDAVVVGRLRRMTTWTRALGLETLAQKLLVVSLMSGLVSFLLARYLTRPLRKLRHASQRLAAGELDVRVAPELGRTDAELTALARDFDAMAARVQELLNAKQRLLSDVSHELNSPLARLRVALELARQGAPPDERGPLDRIEREAERLGVLVEGILAVSRVEHAPADGGSPVDLTALVDEVVRDADFEARAADRRVVLKARGDAGVRGDPETLRRAIENVVRNAVRFTAEGTEVEVSIDAADGEVRVTVRDRGPGVPEEALPHIFEPLFRVDPDRDRRTGGAGLGLAIAERALRSHGGSVEAANAEGGGLRVTLRLPAAAPRARRREPARGGS
ncbi:MAG TPA: ATP-binding protein [Sandaracinaceae bacterium LLY-WYZ-13_1]|nr:ATP-binding protein [Sandaracinaceae bacterium LLY-WYZ-13_1]